MAAWTAVGTKPARDGTLNEPHPTPSTDIEAMT